MPCQPPHHNRHKFHLFAQRAVPVWCGGQELSIIIPTFNEEKYLPKLLKSIKRQNFSDYEIIVADAGSEDKTLEVAKKYRAKLTKGGSPAYGRNQGVKIARANLLLFLDADVILPESFLEKSLNEFKKRKLNIASFQLVPIDGRLARVLFDIFYNIPIIILEKILPHAAMGILIEKELFFKLNGFDESIKLAEDHELSRRAKKISRFGIIKGAKLLISTRRFQKEGWIKTALKYFLCELHMLFLGPVRRDIFKYRFNYFKKRKNDYNKIL